MLDEPTATLDSAARRELIALLNRLCREEGRTILMVTHRVEELLEVADRWVIMHEGRAVFYGDADELADRADELSAWGVAVPEQLRCWSVWTARLPQLAALPLPRTPEAMARVIAEAVRGSEEQPSEDGDRLERLKASPSESPKAPADRPGSQERGQDLCATN